MVKIDKYWRQIIEQTKFVDSPLVKAFKKQTEIQVGALKSIKIYKLKQIEGIFLQKLTNDLGCPKIKKNQ